MAAISQLFSPRVPSPPPASPDGLVSLFVLGVADGKFASVHKDLRRLLALHDAVGIARVGRDIISVLVRQDVVLQVLDTLQCAGYFVTDGNDHEEKDMCQVIDVYERVRLEDVHRSMTPTLRRRCRGLKVRFGLVGRRVWGGSAVASKAV